MVLYCLCVRACVQICCFCPFSGYQFRANKSYRPSVVYSLLQANSGLLTHITATRNGKNNRRKVKTHCTEIRNAKIDNETLNVSTVAHEQLGL